MSAAPRGARFAQRTHLLAPPAGEVPGNLGGQARLAKPAEFPWKRVLLWAVLVLSVCVLAWMAYRVAREMGENAPR
jgi:hypothetical protein